MKFCGVVVTIFFLICSVTSISEDEHSNIEPLIFEDLVNSTIAELINSFPEVLDITDPISLNSTGGLLNGYLVLPEIHISGIRNLVASSISLALPKLDLAMTLEISELAVSAKYDVDDELLGMIHLHGNGDVNITISTVKLDVKTYVGGVPPPLILNDLTATLTLEKITVNFEGLFDNKLASENFSSALNILLEQIIVPVINELKDIISLLISPIIGNLINDLGRTTEATTQGTTSS